MADVEQTQKMIPFITCEVSLCQYVCELVLGVNVFDFDLGVQIDSIKQPIKSNFCGFWKRVSLLDFFPFVIILVTASLSSKMYNKASSREECTFEERKPTLSRS